MVSPDSVVPSVITGAIAVVAGILVLIYRKQINAKLRERQRSLFGERATSVSAGRQSPFMMGVVGVLIVGVGICVIVANIYLVIG